MKATQATFSTAVVVLLLGLTAGCTPSTPQPSPSDGTTTSDTDTSNATPSPADAQPGPDAGGPATEGADPTDPENASTDPDQQPPSDAGDGPAETTPQPSSSPTGGTTTPPPARPEPGEGGTSTVTPMVVYAGVGSDLRITVNGFVPDIVEEGGTCTAALVGTAIAASSPAVPDASTTWCEEIVMDRPEGDPSDWRIVLRYTSPTHHGSSTPTPVSTS